LEERNAFGRNRVANNDFHKFKSEMDGELKFLSASGQTANQSKTTLPGLITCINHITETPDVGLRIFHDAHRFRLPTSDATAK
jgi:hypothetical protein